MEIIKSSVNTLTEESKKLTNEILEKMIGFLTGAFGLVAGLAWNDAIVALIEYMIPLDKSSVVIKFVHATILTILLVVVTIYLVKFFQKKKIEDESGQ